MGYFYLISVTPGLCQTPVIGGNCRLGTSDVQIGGKQTQFFLKCEATTDSSPGEGVWVVKSRAAAAAPSGSSGSSSAGAALPVENTQPQQHPKLMRKLNAPNICASAEEWQLSLNVVTVAASYPLQSVIIEVQTWRSGRERKQRKTAAPGRALLDREP
ncbi:unnamed protein product [Strongylus vulgaris]|uniref:Uncharacterized protein n=1 Tax=Strongylus vulgaris TaxID=40348 RepID=A0A3P7LRE5_STRVU|nr:unnamed protein product [Strongylus vulgaris]